MGPCILDMILKLQVQGDWTLGQVPFYTADGALIHKEKAWVRARGQANGKVAGCTRMASFGTHGSHVWHRA